MCNVLNSSRNIEALRQQLLQPTGIGLLCLFNTGVIACRWKTVGCPLSALPDSSLMHRVEGKGPTPTLLLLVEILLTHQNQTTTPVTLFLSPPSTHLPSHPTPSPFPPPFPLLHFPFLAYTPRTGFTFHSTSNYFI